MALSFNTPVDICNRGLQHIGATRIDSVLGFNENSQRADACSFVYDKIREAELRRNFWSFAMKRVILRPVISTTRFLAPAMWSSTQTYFVNSIVSDVSGMLWVSLIPDNINNTPNNSQAWEAYFGPLSVQPHDATVSYFPGELVYIAPGDGTYKVYMASAYVTGSSPAGLTAWDSAVSYTKDDVVSYASKTFLSLIDLNVGQVPSATAPPWDTAVTYPIGGVVGGSDGTIYASLIAGNVARDPTADGGVTWQNTGVLTPWLDVTANGLGSDSYTGLTVALTTRAPAYPIGLGDGGTANLFRLPANFLRHAPQNPKQGSQSFLGGPGYRTYDDWIFESGYIVSGDAGPIMLRFVANVTQVSSMDVMFCEGIAARIGFEVCEELTQSATKKTVCQQEYGKFMGEARTVNAIEAAEAVEPPEDEFISCRA